MKYITTFYEFGYGGKHKKLGEVEGILLIPLYVDFEIYRCGYFQTGSEAELRIILKKMPGKSSRKIKFRD
jgi:hypothetical protein